MKLKIKEVEIECTVDEFKSLYEAGLLDDLFSSDGASIDQVNWEKLLTQSIKMPAQEPWRDQVITAYGCGMPESYTSSTSTNSTMGIDPNKPTA